MSREVEHFSLSGYMREINVEENKQALVQQFEELLRDEGYIPHLDISPVWQMDFNLEREMYAFNLTVYVVEEENAWDYEGISDGRLIKRYTPNPK